MNTAKTATPAPMTAWAYYTNFYVKVITMSRSYFTEDAKLAHLKTPRWTFDECMLIHEILWEKGYIVNCVTRRGYDGKWKEAWQVQRKDVPRLVEQLFRQRIVAEFQAEGHGNAGIIFGHPYAAETIIEAAGRFQKNKEESL